MPSANAHRYTKLTLPEFWSPLGGRRDFGRWCVSALIEFAGRGHRPLDWIRLLLAKGVKTAVQEKGLLGALTGGFTASSAGIGAAVFFGLLVALSLQARRYKQKRTA